MRKLCLLHFSNYIRCASLTTPATQEVLMLLIKLVLTGLALLIAYWLYEFVQYGRAASTQTYPPSLQLYITTKKSLFVKTACLLGTFLLFIVGLDTGLATQGHHQPASISYHILVGLVAMCCFLLMRVRTGVHAPGFHRKLGYITVALFAYMIVTGLWQLWMLPS